MWDFDDLFSVRRIDYKLIIIILAAILVALYFADLMFGKRSFSHMVDLENNLKILEKRVKTLKKRNAILQKEYFELKELEGQ
jgi:cell division protein FtsB